MPRVTLEPPVPIDPQHPWRLTRRWTAAGLECGVLSGVFRNGGGGAPIRLGFVRVPHGHPWFDLPNHHPALAELRALAWIPVSCLLSEAVGDSAPVRCLGVLTFPGNPLEQALHGPAHLTVARRVLLSAGVEPEDDIAHTLASAMAVVLAVAIRRDPSLDFVEQCLADTDARVREYAVVRLVPRLHDRSSHRRPPEGS
ncbi:MAG: hypothetical protein ABS52_11080 [Gemmatimonadetes bacterium SCN 70-22]|nr:MAG: hypothetical protein ABS52_11080 [Gemmatimonadetes bacterium SCN 70-22]